MSSSNPYKYMYCVGGNGEDGNIGGGFDSGIYIRPSHYFDPQRVRVLTNEVILVTPASDHDIDPSIIWNPIGTTDLNYLKYPSILRREAFPIYYVKTKDDPTFSGCQTGQIDTTYEHIYESDNIGTIFSHLFQSDKRAYTTTRVSSHYIITGNDGSGEGEFNVESAGQSEIEDRIQTENDVTVHSPGVEDMEYSRVWNVDDEGYMSGNFSLGYVLIPLSVPDSDYEINSNTWTSNFPFNKSNGQEPDQRGISFNFNHLSAEGISDLSANIIVYNHILDTQTNTLKRGYEIGRIGYASGTFTVTDDITKCPKWNNIVNDAILIYRHTKDSSAISSVSNYVKYGRCICLELVLQLECDDQPDTDIPIDVDCLIEFPFLKESIQNPSDTDKSLFGYEALSEQWNPCLTLSSHFKTHSETPIVTIPEVKWFWHYTHPSTEPYVCDRFFNLPKLTSSSTDSSIEVGKFTLTIPNEGIIPNWSIDDFYSSSTPVTFVNDYKVFYNTGNLALPGFNDLDNEDVPMVYDHILNFYPERTKDIFTKYGLSYPEVLVSVYSNRYVSDTNPLWIEHKILAQTVAMSSNPTNHTDLSWADPTWLDDEAPIGIFNIDYKQGMWLEILDPNTSLYTPLSQSWYGDDTLDMFNSYGEVIDDKRQVTFRICANNKFKVIIPDEYSGYNETEEANRMISEKLENNLIIYPSIRLYEVGEGTYCDLPISLMKNDNGDVENGQLHNTLLDDEYENPNYIFEYNCNLTEWNHELYLKRDTDLDSYSYGNYNKTLLEKRNEVSTDFAGSLRLDGYYINQCATLSNKNYGLFNFINPRAVKPYYSGSQSYPILFDDFYGLYNLYKCTQDFEYAGYDEYSYKKYILSDACFFDIMTNKILTVNSSMYQNDYKSVISNNWKQCVYSLKCNSSNPKKSTNTCKVKIEFASGYGFTHTERLTNDKDYIYVICRHTNDIVRRSIKADTRENLNVLWNTGEDVTNYDGIDAAIAAITNPGDTHYYYKITENCTSCGACTNNVCPINAIKATTSGPYTIDKTMCIDCGKCVNEINCPSGAIERTSEIITGSIPFYMSFDIYYLPTGDNNPHYYGYLLDSIDSVKFETIGSTQHKQILINHDIEIPKYFE